MMASFSAAAENARTCTSTAIKMHLRISLHAFFFSSPTVSNFCSASPNFDYLILLIRIVNKINFYIE
jgi:hypothetical protein